MKQRLTTSITLVLILGAFGTLFAAESLMTLFPRRAQVTADQPGLQRLALPPEVIGACRSDLADIRLLTATGQEIPFLVDSPRTEAGDLEVLTTSTPTVLTADRSRRALDRSVIEFTEAYRLAIPPVPKPGLSWDLVLSIERATFVSRVTVTGVDRRGHRVSIVEDGSCFRLPDAGVENLRLPIGPFSDGAVTVELTGLDQGYLHPRFRLEARRAIAGAPTGVVDFDIAERRDTPGRTELVVVRPRAMIPRRLVIASTTGTFSRSVTVWDEGPGADPQALGTATLFRIDGAISVEQLEVPIRPARGDRLRLLIDNADSPALEGLGVSARVPRPELVFSLPDGQTSAVLVFGGGRAHSPTYDLAAFEGRSDVPVEGRPAERFLALFDPEQASRATLGTVEANPLFDAEPALAFAMHPGAVVDSRPYSHRRSATIDPSPEGLSVIRLDAEDLAVLRPDLADLRIIDGQSRQWAYLKQDRSRSITVDLEVVPARREGRRSVVQLTMANPPQILHRIRLTSDSEFFDRPYTLTATLDGDPVRVVSSRLIRTIGDPRPVEISVEPPVRADRLIVEIDDGDDAPLSLTSASNTFIVPNLYLAAEPGRYDIVMGYPDARSPRYELERVRSTVLAVPAAPAALGDLETNPRFSGPHRWSTSTDWRQWLMGLALCLAVIVIVWLTLRVAREEPS